MLASSFLSVVAGPDSCTPVTVHSDTCVAGCGVQRSHAHQKEQIDIQIKPRSEAQRSGNRTRLKQMATGAPVFAACSHAWSSAQLSFTRWSLDILPAWSLLESRSDLNTCGDDDFAPLTDRHAPEDDGPLANLAVPELAHALGVDLQRQLGRIGAAAGRGILRLCGLRCRLLGGQRGRLAGLALGPAHCAGQARQLRRGVPVAERPPCVWSAQMQRRCQARIALTQAHGPGDAVQRPHSQSCQSALAYICARSLSDC